MRNEVFVVEQNCVYQDADDYDQKALHVMGWNEKALYAYCRLLPPGVKYEEWAIGRVVTSPKARKNGVGRELTSKPLQQFMKLVVRKSGFSAQAYLEKFYKSYGFSVVSEPYDEDGIPHIEMLLDLMVTPPQATPC